MRAIWIGAALAITISSAPVVQAQGADQQMGSVLLYNYYRSGASSGNTENTRIAITNTSASTNANLHFFFVSASGSVADAYVLLAAKQTAAFLATDVDPGATGYILVVAVDALGCPSSHNALIGDAYVKTPAGHAGNLGAVGFKALYSGTLSGCDMNSTTATLNFDGMSYEQAPRVVALDKIPSRADGNDTLVVLNRFGGSLTSTAASIGMASGQLFESDGTAHGFTFVGATQFASSLSNAFPATMPTFETVIPAGQTGWMKVYADSDFALTGAMLNFNANAGAAANAFNGGHNLRALSLTGTASYVMPVIPPAPELE